MNRTINTFNAGWVQGDNDTHIVPQNGYIYALNGRVVFNEAASTGNSMKLTDVGGSALRAFAVERGNKEVHTFCGELVCVGHCDMGDKCLVFLTDGEHSEIGVFTVNALTDTVTYTTLFNDNYDPNGDLLNFQTGYQYRIEADYNIESVDIERVYWWDAKREPRCLNIRLCYDANGQPWHNNQECGVPDPYPWWFSVHSMNLRPDVAGGELLPYDYQTTGGALKSGAYRLTFAYETRDGFRSMYHPFTPMYFVSAVDVLGPYLDVQMSPSNQVTETQIEFRLSNLDTRYYKLIVAFQYAIDDTGIFESFVFLEQEIDPATYPGVINFTLDKHLGTPVSNESLVTDYEWFTKCPAMAIFRDKMIVGGPSVFPHLSFNVKDVELNPIVKLVNNDKLVGSDIIGPGNVNYPFDTNPMMDVDIDSTGYDIVAYTDSGGSPVYRHIAANEYPNYKGPVFNAHFKGYFRKETYPFAIVLFDKKMRPMYAQDLRDITFPPGYQSGFYPTEFDAGSGTFQVQIMGLGVSNIQIPATVLYDENGDLQVSGFAIVRAKRKKRLKYQGIITNTVYDPQNGDVEDITYPHPFITNDYSSSALPFNVPINYYFPPLIAKSGSDNTWYARPGAFQFFSPDVFIEQGQANIEKDDYIEYVRTCYHDTAVYGETVSGVAPYLFPITGNATDYNSHEWGKMYATAGFDRRNIFGKHYRISNARLVEKYKIESSLSTNLIDDYDPDNLALSYDAMINSRIEPTNYGNGHKKGAVVPRWTVLMKCRDAALMDTGTVPPSTLQPYSYYIVNIWGKQQAQYDTNENGSRLYVSTGHFQPINATVLADVPTDTIDGVLHYRFDDVEVWGGDCYLSYWDFTMLCPWYWSDCDQELDDTYKDQSVSMIVPVESRYNYDMRYGRRFVRDGVFPEAIACEVDPYLSIYYKGINKDQQSDWNVNGSLQYEETIRFYPNKPPNLQPVADQQTAIYYSQQKSPGELADSFRIFLPLDFGTVEGTHGKITGLHRVFNGLYCIQERSLSALRINLRTILATSTGAPIETGTGSAFDGADYISRDYGCQSRTGATTFGNTLHYADARMRTFCRHSGAGFEGISDVRGFHSLSWNILQGFESLPAAQTLIQCAPDRRNKEIIYSLYRADEGTSFTIAFNEMLDALGCVFSFSPDYLLNYGKYICTTKTTSLYLHQAGRYGEYYGVFYSSKLRFVVNAGNMQWHKIFDTMQINCKPDTYQRIGEITLVTANTSQQLDVRTDARARMRNNMLRFPLMQLGQSKRVFGQDMEVELTIHNEDQEVDDDDIQVIITEVTTQYRFQQKE